MKSYQNILLTALLSIAAVPVYAADIALVKSLLHPGEYRDHFEVIPQAFFGVYPYEMNFTFTYVNPCTGAIPRVALRSPEATVELGRVEGVKTFTMLGYGPIDAIDSNPMQTKRAATNVECEIVIKAYSADLGPTSQLLLSNSITFLKNFAGLFGKAQNLDTLSMNVRTLIAQLDPSTLGVLLKTVYDNLSALRQGFVDAEDDSKVEALGLALDELESAICDNPVFRSQNPAICKVEPSGTVDDKTVAERIASELEKISTISKDVSRQVADSLALQVTDTWKVAAYAESNRRDKAASDICAAVASIKPVIKECEKKTN